MCLIEDRLNHGNDVLGGLRGWEEALNHDNDVLGGLRELGRGFKSRQWCSEGFREAAPNILLRTHDDKISPGKFDENFLPVEKNKKYEIN